MKKYLKLISKVLFIVIVTLMLFKLYSMTMEEDVKKIALEQKVYEISQESIVSSGKEIRLQSFKDLSNVKWLDQNKLLLTGDIDKDHGVFLFDLQVAELMRYQEETYSNVDYDNYQILEEIPGYGLLAIKDSQIGLLNDGAFKEIAENAIYKNEIRMMVSDDLSKLIYYHAKNDSLVSYSFEKNFYKTINVTLTDSMLMNFNERVKVSPMGGYISVERRDELIENSNFSIYGADSGRLYADEVYGMYLSWSQDEQKVCFYYSKESQVFDEVFDEMTISSRRIGYYDVKRKKIGYIDSSSQTEWIVSQIYWSDDRITMLLGNLDEGVHLTKILSYDFTSDQYNEWPIDFEVLPSGVTIDLIDYDETYILLVESNGNYQINRINKETKAVLPYKDLKAFDTLSEKDIYFLKNKQKFLTVNKENIVLTTDNHEYYLPVDESFYLLPSIDFSYLAVWLIESQEVIILDTN